MSFPGRWVQRTWHLVDADNQTVGRLASQVAQILKGKHKPTFLPHGDCGDVVVVVNAEKVSVERVADQCGRPFRGYSSHSMIHLCCSDLDGVHGNRPR